jgi:hypothetical protein
MLAVYYVLSVDKECLVLRTQNSSPRLKKFWEGVTVYFS